MLLLSVTLVIFIYFIFFHNYEEDFSGSAVDNPFSYLTCFQTANGNVVAKVETSLNPMDPKNPNVTIHGLVHPDSVGTNNPRLVKLSDIVDPNVPCDDAKFTAAIVKDIRDSSSKARQLFDKIYKSTNNNKNSTWQTHECTSELLKGHKGQHWCKDVFDVIDKDPSCDPNAPIGTVPHSYCSKQKDLRKYTNSTDIRLGTAPDYTFQNYIKTAGRGCTSNCLVSTGAIPQSINGVSLKDSKGVPLYSFGGTGGLDIVLNPKALAPSTTQEQTLTSSNYYNNYQNCIQHCGV